MKTYEELVAEYRKRQHDTVVDTIATGLTYMDQIAVDTGLLEETGLIPTPAELSEKTGKPLSRILDLQEIMKEADRGKR